LSGNSDEDSVYKLVGPVLMKVDLEESKENVNKRLQFIEAEITKLDNQIAEKQGTQTSIAGEVMSLV
jgi:prefoldin beta subunit